MLAMRRVAVAVLVLAGSLFAQEQQQAPLGFWNGTIQSRAGEVNFGVDIEAAGTGALKATLVNATDRQAFSSAEWHDGQLTLRMNYYDGELVLHRSAPQKLEGEYSRQTSKGMVHIPVALVPSTGSGHAWNGPSLAGDWIFTWPEEKGAENTTRASFQQNSYHVTGTIQPVSGDTGLLHGDLSSSADGKTRFHLSRFDGIHVIALDGEILPDGSLKGHQGGVKALEEFTGVRANDTKTADPNALAETLTHVKDPGQPFQFHGLDASGKVLDQDSTEFKGKPMIVDIFGTWCPNCHDEAPVLEKLYRKYHDQGLEIVGLAYEYVDDTPRNLKQIEIYRQKFGLTFPLLLSGTTDAGQIAKTLPQLVGFGAFPTSIFIDRSGHVHAILAGFTGPSTGQKYQEVQQRMDELTRQIVSSSK